MKLTVDIEEDLHHKLTVASAIRKIPMKDIVEKALKTELNDYRDKKNLDILWGKRD